MRSLLLYMLTHNSPILLQTAGVCFQSPRYLLKSVMMNAMQSTMDMVVQRFPPLHVSLSPLALVYYFLPKDQWKHIPSETNLYWRQTQDDRVDVAFAKGENVTNREPKTKEKVQKKMTLFRPVQTHEFVHWLVLMLPFPLQHFKSMKIQWATNNEESFQQGTSELSRAEIDFRRSLNFSRLG
ncbi:hypothetical protein PHMEG_00019852 [Phytophthora megakarya]|uniref:Uncharacterized protein n=1 Tax=Phytophthora megakarya TaxID=4795 RepID=A0A225VRG6_9STRA|nr:hypothetical protein PHMEG_00019852 [Phytophthora megakarya]